MSPCSPPGKVRELTFEDWSCDSSAFRARTGWTPQISLDAGLRSLYREASCGPGDAAPGIVHHFLAWAPERSPAPFPSRRAGPRHDRPLTQAQRVAAQLLTTQGPKHQRLRLRHRRRPRLRSATGRRYAVSVTHSDGLVLVAWAAGFGVRLGVDCERTRRNPRASLVRRLPGRKARDLTAT